MKETVKISASDLTYKAYGAYSGSYDGGGVDAPLYWNIEDAREKCLEYVKEFDEENERMRKLSLEGVSSKKHIEYYNRQYPPMKENRKDYWSNTFSTVTIVEYDIV